MACQSRSRRGNSKPHGFPHQLLKVALFAQGLQSVRTSEEFHSAGGHISRGQLTRSTLSQEEWIPASPRLIVKAQNTHNAVQMPIVTKGLTNAATVASR